MITVWQSPSGGAVTVHGIRVAFGVYYVEFVPRGDCFCTIVLVPATADLRD